MDNILLFEWPLTVGPGSILGTYAGFSEPIPYGGMSYSGLMQGGKGLVRP